jgi:hypothetical protein
MPWRHRIRHYIGMRRQAAKLARLLRDFRFGTAQGALRLREPARWAEAT